MPSKFEAEIRAYHVDLVDWFTGRSPRTTQAYSALSDVIAPEFVIISPNGVISERDAVLPQMEGAHGVLGGKGKTFTIEIEKCRLRFEDDRLCFGTFEAWQTDPKGTTVRLSSVVLRRRDELRNGLEWLHLHETWLDGHAPE